MVAALVANSAIAVAKFIGFLFTRSGSMLAESVHSVADSANQALLLWGQRSAKRAPTPEHPFGYGRERYFWAFVVSLVLFSLGSLFALREAWEKIRHPHELESLEWAIGILIFAIVVEGFSLRTAVVEANKVRGQASWWQFIRRSKDPELPVVVMEDAGAMAGLVIALGAVLTAEVTGDPVWDGIGTLLIGLLLGVIAIVLALEMKSLLIGESASADNRRLIEQAVASSPSVVRVINMRTQHLGPDDLLVAAKVEFDHSLDTHGLAAAVDELETRVRDVVPAVDVMYIEPDVFRLERSAGAGQSTET